MPCAQAQREVLSGIVVADQNASVLISKQENRDWHHPVVVMECQSFVPLLRLPNSLLQIMRSDSGYCARVCKKCCCGQCRNVTLLLIGWMLLCTVVVPYVYEVETQEDEVRSPQVEPTLLRYPDISILPRLLRNEHTGAFCDDPRWMADSSFSISPPTYEVSYRMAEFEELVLLRL
jgi:hypothetical protein